MELEFLDASLVCAKYEQRIERMVNYVKLKVEMREWDNVSEAASQLRVMEAELAVWQKFRSGNDVLS